MTIAAMYARLDELVPRQYAAMRAHPLMIAGPGDLDSELPPVVPGAVAKGGAEALGCIALPEQGLGVALRVEDGGYRAVEPGLMAVLCTAAGVGRAAGRAFRVPRAAASELARRRCRVPARRGSADAGVTPRGPGGQKVKIWFSE